MKNSRYSFYRFWFFIFFDALFSFISFFAAYLLRFNFEIPEIFFGGLWLFFAATLLLKIASFLLLGLYKIPWRFFSLDGLKILIISHICAYSIFFAALLANDVFSILELPIFPRSIPFIDCAISIVLIGALRVSKRFFLDAKLFTNIENIAIFGANENGERQFRSLDRGRYRARFFIDADPAKTRMRIHSLPIAPIAKIADLAKKYRVKTAIVALDQSDKNSGENMGLGDIYEILKAADINKIKIARSALDSGEAEPLKIEDLLARNPKDLDKDVISAFVRGKKILITGAGGSIGSEIARIALKYGAGELILVDSSEYNLYQIGGEINSAILKMVSVTDEKAIDKLFAQTKPQIVIHAAAYKHVPLAESNPKAAVINNILGAKNCIDAAIKYGAESFVFISTDKAVRPTSVMGATKRVCELYLQNVPCGATRLSAVRFGNVLGSSGSVVPLFAKLIAQNQPLTVTHPEITRYFMLIGEAVLLVLQAAAIAKGGEVFVLDMGKSVKIADLAHKMLELSGRNDLGVVFTRLRPGEKLYEELLIEKDDKTTSYPSIFVGKKTACDFNELCAKIATLLEADEADEIALALKTVVPEFNHNREGGDNAVNLSRV